jgi:hypothetical protein
MRHISTILSPIVQRAADRMTGYTAYHAGRYMRREFPRKPNPWPSWSHEHRAWQSGWNDEDAALEVQKWARVCPVFRYLIGVPS